MSAWIVSKAHIDALVTQALVEGLIEPEWANLVGVMLWTENHNSVNIRYREDTLVPEYVYEAPGFDLDPLKVHTLIDCWDYQCAEWEGYDKTPGARLMASLQNVITAKHGTPSSDERGPWGIESMEEVKA